MKKLAIGLILVGMIGILLGCTTPGNDTQATPTSTQFLVLPLDVNGEIITSSSLRNGPGTVFEEIATLPQGSGVHIFGTSTDIKWYLILYDDSQGLTIKGWISVDSVNLDLLISDQLTYTPYSTPSLLTGTTNPSPISATSTITTINTLPSAATLIVVNTLTPKPTTTITLIAISTVTFTETFGPTHSITYPTKEPTSTKKPIIKQTVPPPPPTSTKPPPVIPPFFKKTPTPTPKN